LEQIQKVSKKEEEKSDDELGEIDSEDEEYELNGGDIIFYTSVLEPLDEVLEVKKALEIIAQTDMDAYQKLVG